MFDVSEPSRRGILFVKFEPHFVQSRVWMRLDKFELIFLSGFLSDFRLKYFLILSLPVQLVVH